MKAEDQQPINNMDHIMHMRINNMYHMRFFGTFKLFVYLRSSSDEKAWQVTIGMHHRSNANQYQAYVEKFNVSRIIQHQQYSPAQITNDIAIMVLDGNVKENDGVAPACVTREMYQPGENCTTLGWGTTEQSNVL